VIHYLTTATTTDEEHRNASVAVLPVGSCEQHGPYLPLITDTLVACALTSQIAETYPVLALPPVTITCSHEHSGWPGTVSISARTLYDLIDDIYASVTRPGAPSALVVVNAHGGNDVLRNIVQEHSAAGHLAGLYPARQDWDDARRAAGLESTGHEDMHAGEMETSILLHACPEVVRDGYQQADWTADDRRDLPSVGMRGYTESGIIGRPSLGSAVKGKAALDALVAGFARMLTMPSARDARPQAPRRH
jgi:creatinine amidohydrolase